MSNMAIKIGRDVYLTVYFDEHATTDEKENLAYFVFIIGSSRQISF